MSISAFGVEHTESFSKKKEKPEFEGESIELARRRRTPKERRRERAVTAGAVGAYGGLLGGMVGSSAKNPKTGAIKGVSAGAALGGGLGAAFKPSEYEYGLQRKQKR